MSFEHEVRIIHRGDKTINATYIGSQSMKVQGKANDIYKRYDKDWKINTLGNGKGNWLLTKKSDVLINGISHRNKVLELYHKTSLTRSLFERYCHDIETGKVAV